MNDHLLPPGWRCSAYWYASRCGLPTVMCFLQELGSRAARDAHWRAIPPAKVPEGNFWVHTWEPWLWNGAAASMAPYRTAWEYATSGRMLAGDSSDAEFTAAMAAYAADLARRLGVPLRLAREGPRALSEAYPDWIWSRVTEAMAQRSAEDGDWHLYDIDLDGLPHGGADLVHADPEHPHGYWEAGDYDDVTALPGPQGEQAIFDIGY